MCDFGNSPSVSSPSNVTPMGISTLPDMDELLDRLENEPIQLLVELSSQSLTIKNEFPPSSNSTQQNSQEQRQEKQIGPSSEIIKGEKVTTRGIEEGFHLNRDFICAGGHGQIMSEQQHDLAMSLPSQSIEYGQQREQLIEGNHSTEKYLLAFKKGKETSTINDDDIFEQIDQMAAQIKAEELDQEVEGRSAHARKFIPSSLNTQCLDKFVEEMVESILQRVLAETTDVIEKDEQNSAQIKVKEIEGEDEENHRSRGDAEEKQKDGREVSAVPLKIGRPPSPPPSPCLSPQTFTPRKTDRHDDSLAIVHDLSVALDEFKLTESELQLGKKKPYWIPDEECLDCMLCATRFSIVNRRHHCRACGRVLCRVCCSKRRLLAYMDEKEGKQRVCVPCNRTLDRIEEYEQRRNSVDQRDAQREGTDQSENGATSEETRQRTEQKNDSAAHSLRQSADISPTNFASARPKKKSLLKQSSLAVGTSAVVADHRLEVAASSGSDNSHTLEQKQPMSVPTGNSKRSVTFRDGVNPGHEGNTPNAQSIDNTESVRSVAGPSLYHWLISGGDRPTSADAFPFDKKPSIPIAGNGTDTSQNDIKKLQRKMSRRSREKRMEEEAQSLLILKADANQTQNECRIWLIERRSDGAEEMVRRELAQVARALCNAENENCECTIALRRNFHLRIERRKICAEDRLPVLAVSTRGLASFGVDELFLAFQFDRSPFVQNELDSKSELLALLQQYELIFQQCLADPQEVPLADHKMGIRKCVFRMTRLYPWFAKGRPMFGHKMGAIFFHRPHHNQNFANFRPPSHPFLVGVFVHEDELPLVKCVPCRLLLRLGMLSGEYPFPVVNVRRQCPLFSTSSIQCSVLKVLNDFRFWSYRMALLSGCTVAIRDTATTITLSFWALDDLRQIVTTNRNMVGWALDQLDAAADVEDEGTEVDAHLVCVQEESDGGVTPSLGTRVFSSSDNSKSEAGTVATKKAVGVSFVIFDGALRGNEQLSLSLVEDGLVVRLNADLMEQLVKALTTGDYFAALNEQGHRLSIAFRDPNDRVDTGSGGHKSLPAEAGRIDPGALRSPIDGKLLEGQIQYGLDSSRLLRSLYFFQFSPEWALRLSAVINLLPGKFPAALQPRFFDLCEQLAKQIVPTLEPFLRELIAADQRSIALRVHVDGEAISYETERWAELPEQHFVWTVTLDEQLIPFLYGLCAWLPSVFFVELHTFIVSTRPLPALTVPDSPGDS